MEEIDALLAKAQMQVQEALLSLKEAWEKSTAAKLAPVNYHLSSAFYDAESTERSIKMSREVIALATKP